MVAWVNSIPSGLVTYYALFQVVYNESTRVAFHPSSEDADGTMKWYIETGGAIESSASIDKDGTIYIASTDGKLYAIGEKMEIYP